MKFKSDIEVQAGLRDGGNDIGTAGQLLSSTGAVTNWIDQGGVVAGEADKAKSVILRVKNSTLSAMTKGQVICENVSISPPNGNLIEVALADNNTAGRMPALGILNEDLDAAGGNNDEGDAIMFGKVSGIDTSSFSVGDEVFVSDVPGGLTITKPTGVKYIQKVGVVIRDDNTNGTIEVFGAGRVNDVPTPLYIDHANQRLGIGAINPTQKLDIRDGELVFTSSVVNQNPSGRIRFNEYSDSQVSGAYIDYDGSSNAFSMFTNDTLNDYEFLRANRNSHLLLQPNGNNVGIGTTSPSGRLTIGSGLNTDNSTMFNVNGQHNDVGFNGGASGLLTQGVWSFINSATWDQTRFYVQDQNNVDSRLTFDFKGNAGNTDILAGKSTGKVGIGTTNPSERLVVRNGTSNTDVKILAYNSAAGTEATLKFSTIASETNFEKAAIIARNPDGSWGRSDMHFALDSAEDSGNVEFSDTKMTILNGGNVGIGETDPESKLHIKTPTASSSDMLLLENYGWAANMTTGIAFKNGISYQGQTAKIYTIMNGSGNQGGEIRFATLPYSGTNPNPNTTLYDRMTIDDLGGVGIGTTNPDVKLEVESTESASGIRIKNTNSGYASLDIESNRSTGSNLGGLRYRKTGQANSQAEINYVAGTRLDFLIGNGTAALTNKLSILENGDVGINDNTPSYKLDVAGTGRFTDILRSDKFLQIQGAGTTSNEAKGIGLNIWEDFAYVGNDSTTRYLNHYGMGIHKPLQGSLPDGNGAYLSGYFGVDIFTSGNSRVHVNQNGNVGIGTTDPSEKLEVGGKVYIESQGVAWDTTTPGTTRGALHFDPVGNAANNTGNAITFGASDTGSGSTAQAGIYTRTDSTYGTRMYFATTDQYTSGSKTRMTIYQNGNVGIGSLTPGEKLDVVGNIKVSGEQYFNGTVIYGDGKEIIKYSDSWLRINQAQNFTNGIYCGGGILRTDGIFQVGPSGSKFVVNSIGNVGIGTTSPANDLEIARTTSGAVAVLNLSGGTLGQYGGGGTINIKGGGQYMNFGLNVKNSSAGLESSIGYSGSTRTWTFDGNQLGENGGGYTSYNFKSEGSSQMVIYNNNVGIGVTNPNVRLEIGGGSTLARVIPAINNQGYIGDSQHRWQAIYATNGTIQTSDIREKTEIKPTELGLDFINDLNPVSYKWAEGERLDASKDERNHQGLIAQEVAETLEKHGVDKNKFGGLDIQKTDEYDDFHAMSYEQLIAPMIKSIQELKAEIEELKKQINK